MAKSLPKRASDPDQYHGLRSIANGPKRIICEGNNMIQSLLKFVVNTRFWVVIPIVGLVFLAAALFVVGGYDWWASPLISSLVKVKQVTN